MAVAVCNGRFLRSVSLYYNQVNHVPRGSTAATQNVPREGKASEAVLKVLASSEEPYTSPLPNTDLFSVTIIKLYIMPLGILRTML